MRGRPPKPTKVLELSGAFAKNPARRRARAALEIVPDGELGAPPAEWIQRGKFSQEAIELLAIWYEVLDQLPRVDLLTSADRLFLEMACRLTYKIRFRKSSASDYAQLNRYLDQIRLTPSGRARATGTTALPKPTRTGSAWSELVG